MTLLTLVISIQSFFSQEVFTKMTFELLVQLPDRFFHGSETRHTSTHTSIQVTSPPLQAGVIKRVSIVFLKEYHLCAV